MLMFLFNPLIFLHLTIHNYYNINRNSFKIIILAHKIQFFKYFENKFEYLKNLKIYYTFYAHDRAIKQLIYYIHFIFHL